MSPLRILLILILQRVCVMRAAGYYYCFFWISNQLRVSFAPGVDDTNGCSLRLYLVIGSVVGNKSSGRLYRANLGMSPMVGTETHRAVWGRNTD